MVNSVPAQGESPFTVIVPMPPSYRGGTEEYAYRLVKGFSEVNPTVALSTTVRWNERAEMLDTGTAVVERFPAHEVYERPLLLSPNARRQMWATIRRSRLVNLHMPFPFVEAHAVRLAHRSGIPVILTYHMDADLRSARNSLGAAWVTRLYQRRSAHPALEECDMVVSNSLGYARASPILSAHLDRVHVIPKGVDPVRLGIGSYSGPARLPGSIPDYVKAVGCKRVLFVGRLVPYKGVTVLLDALAELRKRRSDVELLVAGRGPLLENLQAKAKSLGIGERVHFLGFVPDADLGNLYRFADVVVVPSTGSLESTATVLEEATACGAPIVGSDIPGAAESLPNDGIRGRLVAPGEVGPLVEAMDRMVSVSRPAPPKTVRTWDDVVADYLDLFSKLGVTVDRAAKTGVSGAPGLVDIRSPAG